MTPDVILSPFMAVFFVGLWAGAHPQQFYGKNAAITPRRAALLRRLCVIVAFLGVPVPLCLWADYLHLNIAIAIPLGLVGTWALQPRKTEFEQQN